MKATIFTTATQIVDELEQSWHQHLEGNDSVREELAEDASLAKDLVIDFKAPVSGTLMPLSQVGSKPFADSLLVSIRLWMN